MNLFKSNYFERAFAGNGLQSIIYYLRKLVNGFDANTQISDGGGIEGVNGKLNDVKAKLEDVKTKLDNLRVDVKADDIDIGEINVDTSDILTLLDERLVKKLWITRADYNALAVKDPETLYIVIESQSNPSNP